MTEQEPTTTQVDGMTEDMWANLRPTEEVDQVGEIELTEEQIKAPNVINALVAEIQERAAIAMEYRTERDTAKTSVKRRHFDTKLTKNNEIAATLIVALERVIEQRKQRGLSTLPEGAADQESSSEESSN